MRLEFELAYYDVALEHYATRTPPKYRVYLLMDYSIHISIIRAHTKNIVLLDFTHENKILQKCRQIRRAFKI